MSIQLKRIRIENWQAIKYADLEIGPINVLIGPNGAGKSNLVQYFHMLNMVMTGNLQLFVGRKGGASSLLHYGPKVSPYLSGQLDFESDGNSNTYSFRLVHGAPDDLVFVSEEATYRAKNHAGEPWVKNFGSGHKESGLDQSAAATSPTLRFIRGIIARCRYFQFHDTSPECWMRSTSRVDDNRFLKDNAGNLAAVLLHLSETEPDIFAEIQEHLREVIPAFREFDLTAASGSTRLDWRDKHAGELFGPHQISDGSLRMMALVTLLSLPDDMIPSVIVIDEPELGLFPAAIDKLVDLVKAASTRSQVILATQSQRLIRYLNPPTLICCGWKNGVSSMDVLPPGDEFEFLDNYTLGDYMER